MLPRLRALIGANRATQPIQGPESAAADQSAQICVQAEWDTLYRQAQELQQKAELDKAVELYDLLVASAPDRSEPYYKRGNTLNGLGRLEEALADFDRAIMLDPAYAYAYCNRGSVLEGLGRKEEALASYDRASELDPRDALTHYNRGSVLKDLGRYEDSLASYDAAIGLDPSFAEACVNRGNVLQKLGQHEAAGDSFARAIALRPTIAEAFLGRGISHHSLRRLREALLDYNKAIALSPMAAAYRGRADLLVGLDRFEEAVKDYFRAAELEPEAEVYRALALPLARLKQFDLAIDGLNKAAELDPQSEFILGEICSTRMHAARWDDGLEGDLRRLTAGLEDGKFSCNPVAFAALVDAPSVMRRCAETWVGYVVSKPRADDIARMAQSAPVGISGSGPRRLRIGYFSADFRTHPVAYLTAGLFEHHDRSRFEVTGFAFGPEANDAMSARLAKAFDRFVDVRYRSDREVVELARQLEIDVAVDLTGFTAHCRAKVFALRAAPIQVNFLGYPGTMGADFMDYLIADGTVVPRAQQRHYAEKIAYLPDSFLPFDSSYAIAERVFTREELGLPSEGVVFCCFNSGYKILPEVFDRWMGILGRTAGSVLWLQGTDAGVRSNLHREALRRGVDAERLIFAPRMESLPEHLARLRAADLFLDTFPYNAHSTAMDALWAGVPVLTRSGESFASRVAGSLLRTAGLSELIADSPSQYEEMAVALAASPKRLGELRGRLARTGSRLFDTERYTRNLESLYEAIHERHRSGSPPAHINEHFAE
jgi:predicted O-linked N-acetylglucosamine transferase (SPINDLY family)